MNKFLQASVVALALTLGGCATTGGDLPGQAQSIVDQVRAYVQQACGFIANATDVATVVTAFYPQAVPVAGAVKVVGDAICKSPTAPTALAGGAPVAKRVSTPRGVVIVKQGG
jgi:hypothetical protein